MGLFSKLRAGGAANNPADNIARSVLAMPLMTAAADGNIDERELDEVLRLCEMSPIFLEVGGLQRTTELAKEIMLDMKKRGMNTVFEDSVVHLSPALRETALAFSIRVAIADGSIDQSEKEMLAAMSERMNIPFDTFVKIFDVLMMLHRRATD